MDLLFIFGIIAILIIAFIYTELKENIKVIEEYEECLGCENETMCEQCK